MQLVAYDLGTFDVGAYSICIRVGGIHPRIGGENLSPTLSITLPRDSPPRVGGENWLLLSSLTYPLDSPPHMRGRLHPAVVEL